jgi:hypothetical protein
MTPTNGAGRKGAPTAREIADLLARLRELSSQASEADPWERAAFLADKDALLARITAGRHDTSTAAPDRAVQPCVVDAEQTKRREQLARWYADDTTAGALLEDVDDDGPGLP